MALSTCKVLLTSLCLASARASKPLATLLVSEIPAASFSVPSGPVRGLQRRGGAENLRRVRTGQISMGPKLHGSQQSRSPLVNFYAYEAGIELEMQPSRPSKHPFNQVPFLTDDDGIEIFESGAILLYLADAYGGAATPKQRAAFTKWVVWSNSELDGLCFGAVPGDHRVRGTSMDKPELKSVAVLESILSENEWLVDNTFSVADVAVGSYLNYVPIFFPQADLSRSPNIVKYMQRCAARPAFAKAFGDGHANLVAEKANAWLSNPAGEGGDGPGDFFKKLMG